MQLIAVTDHDTTEGLEEAMAAGRARGVRVVPGVELSVDTEDYDIHLLGYFIREKEASLQAALQGLRETRRRANAAILERLKNWGCPSTRRAWRRSAAGGRWGGRTSPARWWSAAM